MTNRLTRMLCLMALGTSLGLTARSDEPITPHLPHPTEKAVLGRLEGRVLDSHGKPLPYARVAVVGTALETAADGTGRYTLRQVPAGPVTVEARMPGFRSARKRVETQVGETAELHFALEEDAIALDEVVTTANRSVTLRREAPVLVSVADAKLFEATQSQCMAQGLNFQPGVRTEDNCQNCGFTQVRINGLDGHYSQILIDSRPVFSALGGVYGLEHIPTNMIERIEVVRGGGSALYGASAIGGTINVITRQPIRNSAEIAHTIQGINGLSTFENNTTANATLLSTDGKAGLTLYGQRRYRPGYDHDHDGYTELAQLNNHALGIGTFYRFSPYTKLSLQYHNLKEFRRGGNRLDLPAFQANIAEQTDHDVDGGNVTLDWFSPRQHDRVKTYFAFNSTRRKSYYGGTGEGTPEEVEAAAKAYGRTTDLTWMTGAQYVHDFDRLWFMPAALTVGGEFNRDVLNDIILGYDYRNRQAVSIASAYLQNEWKTPSWSLLLGGRLDKHNLIRRAIFSPRANLRYNLTDEVNLRLTYSGGFRAPQTYDEDLHVGFVGGERLVTRLAPNLKEERSHSFSLSADCYPTLGSVRTNFLIEGFYTLLNDAFALRNLSALDADGNKVQERYNGGGARVYGLTLEGRAALTSWLNLQAGFTLQRAERKQTELWDEDAPAEKRILRTPNTYGYLTATATPLKPLSLSLSGNYTGRMRVGHASHTLLNGEEIGPRAVDTPRFFVLNFKAAYEFRLTGSARMQVNAGVQNLTNAYQKDFDQGWGRDSGYIYGPATPRCYFLGTKITL